MPNLKILLVDNEPGFLTSWRDYLVPKGHECALAQTVDDAEQRAAERLGGFDVALVDTVMPYSSGKAQESTRVPLPPHGGLELAKHLLERWPQVAVVMKTAFGLDQKKLVAALQLPNVYDFVEGDEDLARLELRLLAAVQKARVFRIGPLSVLWGISHRAVHVLESSERAIGRARACLLELGGDPSLCEELERDEFRARHASALVRRAAHIGRGIDLARADMTSCGLRGLVESAVAYVEDIDDARASEVACTCDIPEDITVWADHGMLREALIALLENAFDAVRGAEEKVISIAAATPEAGRVVLELKDTGPGMTEEQQARVLEPFFTTKLSQGGMGLGLCFAWNVVRQHGGDVALVESKLGAGTTFAIELPIEQRGEGDGD